MRAPNENVQMSLGWPRSEGGATSADCLATVGWRACLMGTERKGTILYCLEMVLKVALEIPGLERLQEVSIKPGLGVI